MTFKPQHKRQPVADKAPAEVVEKEKAKLQDALESHDKLKSQQQQLKDL